MDINIDYNQLKASIDTFVQQVNDIEQCTEDISTFNFDECWHGIAHDNFNNYYQEWISCIMKWINELGYFSDALQNYIDNYPEFDTCESTDTNTLLELK